MDPQEFLDILGCPGLSAESIWYLHLLAGPIEEVKLVFTEECHPVPLSFLQMFLSPEEL